MDSAFATILDERNRVLLSLRRDLELWNPPGGGIESGESPWDAVRREVLEETGLVVEVVRLASVSHKVKSGDVLFQFECRCVDPGAVPRPTVEAREHRWFEPGELPERLSPAFVRRLGVWLADRETTHLLVDDGPTTREWLQTLGGGAPR